jgi:putative transposase
MQTYGIPCYLRSDNGPEFVANALKAWLATNGMGTADIEPGKPWQNGAIESFIGNFRDECFNREWFRNRTEARVSIADYRRQYNEERPHSSLAYRTPAEAYASTVLPPGVKCREGRCDPRQSVGLTFPVVR